MTTTPTPNHLDLALLGGVRLTDTGLTISESTTYEQWMEGLKMFQWMKARLSIGLSDYISWGRAKFGAEKTMDALEQLEFPMQDVKAAVAIASVPVELRHPELTGEHYAILAKKQKDFSPDVLKQWASTAAKEHLTPPQLKASIDAGVVVTTATANQLNHGIITPHGIRGSFDIWCRRVGGVKGVLAMNAQAVEEIKSQFDPILEFCTALNAGLQNRK